MVTDGAQLLLVLATREVQTAAELVEASRLDPAEASGQLERLLAEGFILATAGDSGPTVYRLTPGRVSPEEADPPQRLLVVENDLVLRDVVVKILEHEGYAIIAVSKPAEAIALLEHVSFDLVITDGFSGAPGAVLVNSTDVLKSAGATPVALFTAHKLELDAVQAAGFRDLISKPFSIDALWRQVRSLLQR